MLSRTFFAVPFIFILIKVIKEYQSKLCCCGSHEKWNCTKKNPDRITLWSNQPLLSSNKSNLRCAPESLKRLISTNLLNRPIDFLKSHTCVIDCFHLILAGTPPFCSRSSATSPASTEWTSRLCARTTSSTRCRSGPRPTRCPCNNWLRNTGALTSSSSSPFPSSSSFSTSSTGWHSSYEKLHCMLTT